MKHRNDMELEEWERMEESVSLTDLLRTVWRYRVPIFLGISIVMLAWMIGATIVLFSSPERRVAQLPFRLEFKGAEIGQYPNGTRFQSSEILSPPVLLSVYRKNGLQEFIPFDTFRSSLFILAHNDALERLFRDYRARLSDPKLSAVDRAQIEQEFAEKRASLSQSGYTLVLTMPDRATPLPRRVQAKILNDILSTWAEQTIQNKGVVLYDLSVLSSGVFERSALESYDYVITLDMLRSKINRIIGDIDQLLEIPGAKVVRTPTPSRISLAEVRVKLEDMLNFRVQPLAGLVLEKGISKDPTATIQFLETRLLFNELERSKAARRAEAIRESMTTYLQQERGSQQTDGPATAAQGGGTTVIPQFGESFLERLMEMSSETNDLEYRQALIDQLRQQSLAVVPLESEAEYYGQLIQSLRGFESRARAPLDQEVALIRTQIDAVVAGAIDATNEVNLIYEEISKNLNPSTVLFSYTRPPSFSIERSISLNRVLLSGAIILLLSIPLAILAALVHARFWRESHPEPLEEEDAEEESPQQHGKRPSEPGRVAF